MWHLTLKWFSLFEHGPELKKVPVKSPFWITFMLLNKIKMHLSHPIICNYYSLRTGCTSVTLTVHTLLTSTCASLSLSTGIQSSSLVWAYLFVMHNRCFKMLRFLMCLYFEHWYSIHHCTIKINLKLQCCHNRSVSWSSFFFICSCNPASRVRRYTGQRNPQDLHHPKNGGI